MFYLAKKESLKYLLTREVYRIFKQLVLFVCFFFYLKMPQLTVNVEAHVSFLR